MKYFFLLFIILCSGGSLFAQTSIFDAMASPEQGKGVATVRQSNEIRRLVGSKTPDENIVIDNDRKIITLPGYRIQVFTDNNQRSAKTEALNKERQIKELFPDVSTYVIYNAPFWRLRVGDFVTYEEAYSMLCKLVDAFPAFKKEIKVLAEEEVKVQLN